MNQQFKDFRFRALIKSGSNGDHAISIDARKIALKNHIDRRSKLYRLNLEQIQLEFGEDLLMDFWEVVMYMLPCERVRRAIKEYVERN